MKRIIMVLALAGLAGPAARADMFVSNLSGNNVTRYNADSGAYVSTFVSAGSGGLNGPTGLDFTSGGDLLVVSSASNQVLRYNGATGAFINEFTSSHLNAPVFLKVGPDGLVYISNFVDNTITRYNATSGAYLDTFVTAGSGGLNGPTGFDWNAGGVLLVSSTITGNILAYDGTTGAFAGDVVLAGVLSSPLGLVSSSSGNIYVSNGATNMISAFHSEGSFITSFASGSQPEGITEGPGGNIYFANAGSNFVSLYNGGPPSVFASSNLDHPTYLVFNPIPEPAVNALLAAGGTLGAVLAMRRHSGRRAKRDEKP